MTWLAGAISASELAAVFVASLLGSVHCAAMCGPLAAFATAQPQGGGVTAPHASGAPSRGKNAFSAVVWYHAVRGGLYVGWGVLAGSVGAALDGALALAGFGRAATVVFGLLVLLFAVAAFFPRLPLPRVLEPAVGPLLVRLRQKPPASRARLTGALTAILPCGWLHAFVATAAGTASPAAGALVMGAFFLGTVPALLGASVVTQTFTGWLHARRPLVTAVLVLVLGLSALVVRAGPMLRGSADQAADGGVHAHCH